MHLFTLFECADKETKRRRIIIIIIALDNLVSPCKWLDINVFRLPWTRGARCR